MAGRNCSPERIPQGAAFQCRIDAGLGDSTEGARRVISANSGRDSRDVWLDVHTGEGRLRRQKG